MDELKTGDVTPWYVVRDDAVEDDHVGDWYSARVFHFTSEREGWVHQRGSDEVPVELKDESSSAEESLQAQPTPRG